MIIYRLLREKYSHELSGIGASLKGARWNSSGTQIIYCAENRALALAELMVHISAGMLPADLMLLSIELPKQPKMKRLDKATLPSDWNKFPYTNTTQHIGDTFIADNKYLLLRLPSAVVIDEYNIAINPFHSDFKKVKIKSSVAFPLDDRLFL